MEISNERRAEEFDCSADISDGIFCRFFARREEKARAKKARVNPDVRATPLYLFAKSALAKAKKDGFKTQAISAHAIGKEIRGVPAFSQASTRQLSAVLNALVEEGFLRRVPPGPGSNHSSTYVFG
jgi:hypothetical protein